MTQEDPSTYSDLLRAILEELRYQGETQALGQQIIANYLQLIQAELAWQRQPPSAKDVLRAVLDDLDEQSDEQSEMVAEYTKRLERYQR